MAKMFKDNVRSVFVAVCCAAVMCLGSISMVEDVRGMDVCKKDACETHKAHLSDSLRNEYANYGFHIWKTDGQRFLEKSFLDEYSKTGVAPVLEDARPSIELWLNCTLSNNTFSLGWGWETRSEFAKPFLEEMVAVYSKLNIGQDGAPLSYIALIKAIICAIEESEFISRI